MRMPVVNRLIAAGTASAKKVDTGCRERTKYPLSHQLAQGGNRIPGGGVRVVKSDAMTPGDDNHMTRSKSGGFENCEGQRFTGVGHDLRRGLARSYVAEDASWL